MKSEELKKIVNAIPDGKEVIFEYSLYFFKKIVYAHTKEEEIKMALEDYTPKEIASEDYCDDTRCILDNIKNLNNDDYIIGF